MTHLEDARSAVRALREEAGVRALAQTIEATDARTIAEQVELTEIPAPPFHESARGRRMAELMQASGLDDIRTDEVGNVIGRLPGSGEGAPWVVSAHLDTVFPEGTDVSVSVSGSRLAGPGIGDDGRGLAVLLALARALVSAEWELGRPVLFVATVGEEGAGDLRGVRHLFGSEGAGCNAAAFISIDGAGYDRLVTQGVGSRRLRFIASGPGGHSWADYGTPNPIHALGRAVAGLDALELPDGCTLTVGRMAGGTSVNAVPESAWLEMEVRSVSEAELDALEPRVRDSVRTAVEGTRDRRADHGAGLALDVEVIGCRPGGATDSDSALVAAAMAATEAVGHEHRLVESSTDANVPMALGVPAITMGGGGSMGRAHTLEEWYDNRDGPSGVTRALLTLLVLDRLESPR